MPDTRLVIASLREGPVTPPAPEVLEFAARADSLDLETLEEEATALSERPEFAAPIARVVCEVFRIALGDLDEHGEYSEFAGQEAHLRASLEVWQPKAGAENALEAALRHPRLVEAMVAAVEHVELPPLERAQWSALRAAERLGPAVEALLGAPLEPWFAELVAAYLAREVLELAASGSSWQSQLDEVPHLVKLVHRLGVPAVFGPAVLRGARQVVARHPQLAPLVSLEVRPPAST